MSSSLTVFLLFTLFIFSMVQAIVPPSKTFKVVNSGLFYGFVEEGNAAYYTDAELASYEPFKKLTNHPFYLCFFAPDLTGHETNDNFTVALRLHKRLVWIAKQTIPVGRNATLTFSRDGNLVLADAHGKVAWQTGTANMGVVDIKLLSDGNLVLLDKRGAFVWQSFHYPTDVLLAGQSIRVNGVNKLVSRKTPVDPTPGPYSLALDGKLITFYFKGRAYSRMESFVLAGLTDPLEVMTFKSQPASFSTYVSELLIEFTRANESAYGVILVQAQFNTTYSYLQLGQDGNVRFHTYFDRARDSDNVSPFVETYVLFAKNPNEESECKLPERCGGFGVCEDYQCVACPTSKGLMGWSKSCASPELPSCSVTGTKVMSYYKVVGVDHFSSNYGGALMKLADCREKCSKDCKCKGFFYKTAESKCLLTPMLNTLTKVSNSTHLAFIKMSK